MLSFSLQIIDKVDRSQTLKWRIRAYWHENNTNLVQESRITNYDDIINGYFFSKFIKNMDSEEIEAIHMNEILRTLLRKFALIENHLIDGLKRSGLFPGHFRICSSVCTKKVLCMQMKRLS